MYPTSNYLSFHICMTAYLWLCLACLGILGQTHLLHQNIDYHLRELRKNLQQLDESRIYKRSTDYDVIMYRSLTAFCSQLTLSGNLGLDTPPKGTNQTPREHTTTTTTATRPSLHSLAISGHKKVKDEDFANAPDWPRPDIFPLRVKAERWEDKAYFVFYVSHTGPAFVIRSFSFDYKKFSLDYPDDQLTPTLSTILLVADASVCNQNNSDETSSADEVTYGFSLEAKSRYMVRVTIDVCKFDKVWNETVPSGWVDREDQIISQDIPLPLFKVLSDPGDEVLLQRRKNATLDIDMIMIMTTNILIYAQLWDYSSRKLLEPTVYLSFPDKEGVGIKMESSEEDGKEKILSVVVVRVNDINDDAGSRKVSARIRITVATAFKRRSGKLGINYYWRQSGATIVNSIVTERAIWFKHPKMESYLPRNTVKFLQHFEKFQCTKDGTRYFPQHGKNCTLMCRAFGTDISSIFITKPRSNFTPARFVSYVMGNNALAMIDVGPASQYNEGKYKCVVITSNGKTVKKNMTLYTSMFTNVTHVSVEELTNGSVLLTCTAFGLQPLNMSIEVGDDDHKWNRVDDKDTNERSEVTFGDYKNLTLLLFTNQLQYPKMSLLCEAAGIRGSDTRFVYGLEGYITDHNPFYPKINTMSNATYLYNYGNGTVGVTCLGSGGKPLEFWVTYGGASEDYRIDLNPENIRTATETAEGGRMTLLVSLKSLQGRGSWVDCRVGNEHGDDWYSMNTYGLFD